MPHPELINLSPFACDLLFVTDEEGVVMCVPVVQATFKLAPGEPLALLEPPPPINLGGAWWGDAAHTSMRLEPQIAFIKPATDIVLIGHAYPSNKDRTEGLVGIGVGAVRKTARVFGNRRLVKRLGFTTATAPEPFDRIPLTYEYAFGGRDRRDKNPDRHRFEPRNPVGIGYRDPDLADDAEVAMPNLEDPDHLFKSVSDCPPPAGFGFVSPDWQPRTRFAGTYDKAWNDLRKPLLPKDFNRRFFNAASSGLIAPGYLRGDEPVVVIGASASGRVNFNLPGAASPACRVALRSGNPVELQTVLDTLLVDMDQQTVTLTWRAHVAVRRGLHDVVALELPPQPLPVDEDD